MACDRAQCVIHAVAEGGELGHVHVELLQRARIVRLVHLVRARLGVRVRVPVDLTLTVSKFICCSDTVHPVAPWW